MKNRYTIKKIVKDCLFPEGLYEIKDKETKFYLIMEDKKDVDKLKDYLTTKDEQIRSLEEQLKNSITPKFKIGQEVFFVIDKVEQAKIEKLIFTIGKLDDETMKFYSITDTYGYALRLPEEQIFATREEALKRLAELEGK